jgi:hypothetical protein
VGDKLRNHKDGDAERLLLRSDGRVPPMQISDTAVLIAYMHRKDPRHEKANEYVFDIGLRKDLFVQSVTQLEPMPLASSVQAANTTESRRSSPTWAQVESCGLVNTLPLVCFLDRLPGLYGCPWRCFRYPFMPKGVPRKIPPEDYKFYNDQIGQAVYPNEG